MTELIGVEWVYQYRLEASKKFLPLLDQSLGLIGCVLVLLLVFYDWTGLVASRPNMNIAMAQHWMQAASLEQDV